MFIFVQDPYLNKNDDHVLLGNDKLQLCFVKQIQFKNNNSKTISTYAHTYGRGNISLMINNLTTNIEHCDYSYSNNGKTLEYENVSNAKDLSHKL